MKKILKSIGKTILYSSISFVFGLFQILILYFKENIQYSQFKSYNDIILSCGILFFSSSIVGSIFVDYFLNKRTFYGKMIDTIIFYLLPFTVLFATTVIYLSLFSIQNKDQILLKIESLTFAILSTSLFNLCIGKGLIFYSEYKEGAIHGISN